tara:strand:+ start:196 stop:339 length:144 start_codon:yes stop_codon:yes gene_type:complete
MINNILELLQLAKNENIKGKYVDIALGKNKLPNSIKEASIQLIRENK